MNRLIKRSVILIVLLAISIIVYFSCIRDWIEPVNIDFSVLNNIDYFDNKKASEFMPVLKTIHKQSRSNDIITEPYDEFEEYYFENQEQSFERAVWLNFYERTYLDVDYQFSSPYANITVKICSAPEYDFNCLTGPKLNLNYFDNGIKLQDELRENYGVFRPIFNLMSKHGKNEKFEYYISPLIFNKDEYGIIQDYNQATAFMVFVYKEYGILLFAPVLYDKNDMNVITPIVLKDIEKLLKQAEEDYSE